MPIRLATEIEIAAPPSAVWRVLLDFESYKDWNPFIVSLDGVAEEGARLAARILPPGGNEMTFKPTVTIVEKDRVLEWLGSFLFRGILDGRHRFELSATDNCGTLLKHGEEFNGLISRIVKKDLETKTKQGFINMNEALKRRVEEGVHDYTLG